MSLELVGRLLLAGELTAGDVRGALLRHVNGGVALIGHLLENRKLTDAMLERAAQRSLRVPGPLEVDRQVLDALPVGLCTFALAVPLAGSAPREPLTFACVNPSDEHLAGELAYHVGRAVRLAYAPYAAIQSALRELGHSASERSQVSGPRGTTDRPMLLVARTTRSSRLARAPSPADVREVARAPSPADVREVARAPSPADVRDEGGPETFPRAPAVPTFGASSRSGPRKTRGDGSPPSTRSSSRRAPRPPFASIDGVLEAMRLAATRDEVIDCLLLGMGTVARRVAVFAVKKQGFRGVAGNAELGSIARLRELEIALAPPTVLTIAATASTGAYVGPLPATAAHASLRELLGACPDDVIARVVRVASRPAVVLFADNLGDVSVATSRAEVLATVAGTALSRIVAGSKVVAPTTGRP